MIEPIGDMEIICDWDYDNLKLAIEGNTNRAVTVYKPGSNITIWTFQHLRDMNRENLMIFKEIYQNKPTEAPAPIVHMPAAPERPIIR